MTKRITQKLNLKYFDNQNQAEKDRIFLYVKEEFLMKEYSYNILPMENLPPINEMYSSIRENRDFGVVRKYQNSRSGPISKVAATKKGSYLDDEIKMKCSPGPANKANIQPDWSKVKLNAHKYSDRKTYVDQIQHWDRKNNMPSPSQYSLELPWPKKVDKLLQKSEKSNFLDHSQYQSNMTPGPGSYLIATKIAKKVSQVKLVQNHSRQPIESKAADMNTYDPIPSEYNTFKKIEKSKGKSPAPPAKTQPRKPQKQNKHPGPGQYQMVHTWAVGKKPQKGISTFMNKISKAPTPSIYYK